MNKEQIEARIGELQNQERILQANQNAISGAIQDCQYWLQEMGKAIQPEPVNNIETPLTEGE